MYMNVYMYIVSYSYINIEKLNINICINIIHTHIYIHMYTYECAFWGVFGLEVSEIAPAFVRAMRDPLI